MRFKYDGITAETDVQDGAGLHAVWNEKFCLIDVNKQIIAGKKFALEAYDKDIASSDFLGAIRPIAFVYLVEHEEPINQVLDLFDKGKKKAGTVEIESRFIYIPPDPPANPDLNRNCTLAITLKRASFFKDADLIGK